VVFQSVEGKLNRMGMLSGLSNREGSVILLYIEWYENGDEFSQLKS
jgi:hypothetical protein